jgi:hypothetical protein
MHETKGAPMPDLIEAVMRLEGLAKKYLEKDKKLKFVMEKLDPLFRQIYDGKVPHQRNFDAIRDKFADVFDNYQPLEEALDAVDEAYMEAYQKRIRESVGKGFVSHLKEKWTERSCPVCKGQVWAVSNCLFELREFSGGALVIGGDMSLYSVVPVICENCGCTHLFSATRSGLVEATVDWPRLPPP